MILNIIIGAAVGYLTGMFVLEALNQCSLSKEERDKKEKIIRRILSELGHSKQKFQIRWNEPDINAGVHAISREIFIYAGTLNLEYTEIKFIVAHEIGHIIQGLRIHGHIGEYGADLHALEMTKDIEGALNAIKKLECWDEGRGSHPSPKDRYELLRAAHVKISNKEKLNKYEMIYNMVKSKF